MIRLESNYQWACMSSCAKFPLQRVTKVSMAKEWPLPQSPELGRYIDALPLLIAPKIRSEPNLTGNGDEEAGYYKACKARYSACIVTLSLSLSSCPVQEVTICSKGHWNAAPLGKVGLQLPMLNANSLKVMQAFPHGPLSNHLLLELCVIASHEEVSNCTTQGCSDQGSLTVAVLCFHYNVYAENKALVDRLSKALRQRLLCHWASLPWSMSQQEGQSCSR